VQDAGGIVSARAYTDATRGTYGQFMPALAPRSNASPLQMIGIEQSGLFRTNAGLVNFGDIPTTATVVIYDGPGTELGRLTVNLAPRSLQQLPLTAIVSATVVGGRIEVRAAPAVAAYASVINNGTNDPFYIVGQN
jgi:hypothetical protein